MANCEKRLGFSLIERKIGGVSGGGSALTPKARKLLKRYEQFRDEAHNSLNEIFRKHFGQFKT